MRGDGVGRYRQWRKVGGLKTLGLLRERAPDQAVRFERLSMAAVRGALLRRAFRNLLRLRCVGMFVSSQFVYGQQTTLPICNSRGCRSFSFLPCVPAALTPIAVVVAPELAATMAPGVTGVISALSFRGSEILSLDELTGMVHHRLQGSATLLTSAPIRLGDRDYGVGVGFLVLLSVR